MSESLAAVYDRTFAGQIIVKLRQKPVHKYRKITYWKCTGKIGAFTITFHSKQMLPHLAGIRWEQVRKLRPWVNGWRYPNIVVDAPETSGTSSLFEASAGEA